MTDRELAEAFADMDRAFALWEGDRASREMVLRFWYGRRR